MCVDVLKLSPILFNDTNLPPSSLPPWLWGGKCRQKLGTDNFDPKLGRNWLKTNSLSHTQEWMELPDLAVVIHSVRSCDTNCNLTQNFDTNSFSLRALSQTSHIYLSTEMLLKTKNNWGQNFERLSIFLAAPSVLELEQKIRAWKYASRPCADTNSDFIKIVMVNI